jgi:hypothetical protein
VMALGGPWLIGFSVIRLLERPSDISGVLTGLIILAVLAADVADIELVGPPGADRISGSRRSQLTGRPQGRRR